MFRLEDLASELRDVVADLEPATYDGRDATRLTKVAAEVEKLGATAKILLARRAAETRGWVGESSAASSDQWLAQVSGCSQGAAREALATADRVAELPATEAKLRDGTLSVNQASLVSRGAAVDPTSEPRLLRIAGRGEMRNLRAEQERVVVAATDADAAQARAPRTGICVRGPAASRPTARSPDPPARSTSCSRRWSRCAALASPKRAAPENAEPRTPTATTHSSPWPVVNAARPRSRLLECASTSGRC
jgi:hypothetical protein